MAYKDKITIDGTQYEIHDTMARNDIVTNTNDISTLNTTVGGLTTAVNGLIKIQSKTESGTTTSAGNFATTIPYTNAVIGFKPSTTVLHGKTTGAPFINSDGVWVIPLGVTSTIIPNLTIYYI